MHLITNEYKELNRKLHATRKDYGARGHRFSDAVVSIAQVFETRDVLDYGCGKGHLRRALPMIDVKEYDPAVEGKDSLPERADIVCSFDVLEHIEPELLTNVINHIFALAKKAVILNIATRPAAKFLEDGRNAHLTIQPYIWWLNELHKENASLIQFNKTGVEEFLCVYAKGDEVPEDEKEAADGIN